MGGPRTVQAGERPLARTGIALIVVLIVLFTLMVIAAPFVSSMILQERTSFEAIRHSKAAVGAESARNFAMVKLLSTHDYYERVLGTYGADSYSHDGWTELQVPLDDATKEVLGVGDPKGSLWGIHVEDEQGKINLHHAPRNVIDGVLRIAGLTGSDTRDFATNYSVRETRWIHPQRVRAYVAGGVALDNMTHYGAGARVRVISPNRTRPHYAFSGGIQLDPTSGQPYLALSPAPAVGDLGAILEIEARVPVNVNTAPREALAVALLGLRLLNPVNPGEQTGIDDRAALRAAESIYGVARRQAFRNFYDVANFVSGLSELNASQKLAVLVNAVDPTNSLLDGSGTVPFTTRSHEVFTVLAGCSIGDAQGAEAAARHTRSVVDLAPPLPVQHRLETQLDWDRFLTTTVGPNTVLKGFPFGNRMVTFPNVAPADPPDASLANAGKAYVQMVPAKDLRGRVAPIGGQTFFNRWHYDQTVQGEELKGSALTFQHGEIFASSITGAEHADIAAGGVEFWVRFNGGAPQRAALLDCREGSTLNRISLEAENGELLLTVADETISAGSQISGGTTVARMPFAPQPDVWYHVGAYFKGNKFGQLMVLRDGFSHPQAVTEHRSRSGMRISTVLAADLPPPPDPNNPVTPVALADAAWIPPGVVALEIGAEVILYDTASATALRGARGTGPGFHPAGAAVQIFGYATQFIQEDVDPRRVGAGDVPAGYRVPINGLPTGGTTLASPLSTNEQRRLARTINPAELLIPVLTAAFYADPTPAGVPAEHSSLQADFPPKGYVRIDDEMIKYDGFSTMQVRIPENVPNAPMFNVPALNGVMRGGLGTTAADHRRRERVRVASLHVADAAALPAPLFVQAEDEWFGPVVPDPTDRSLYVPPTDDGRAHSLGRGVAGSGQQPHAAGELVLPVFAARPRVGGGARYKLGSGDEVTLTDMNLNRSAAVIHRSVSYQGNTQLGALTDVSAFAYVPDPEGFARILKFPSGELLSRPWLLAASPNVTIGPMDATVDEVKAFASPKSPEWRIRDMLPADTSRDFVEVQIGAMNMLGGAILVGDEIVGYGEVNQVVSWLIHLERGFLYSPLTVHDRGDRLFNLAFLPISTVQNTVSATDASVPMKQPIDIQASEGYVLVDQEVLFFTRRQGNELTMPTRLRSNEGLYRGMFGTQPSGHSEWALVYGLPYRHYDTYKAGEFDTTMAWYQASGSIRDAHWRSLRWTEQTWPGLQTHCLVRIDGAGEFFEPPDGRRLLDLTGGGAAHRMDYHGTRTDDALIETRFLFEYQAGAFYPGDAWKQSPKLYDLAIEYEKPWRILYHEER